MKSRMVIRIVDGSSAWLGAARSAHDAPDTIRALLRGRTRVEVTADEAAHALLWARHLDGWTDDATPPIEAYRLGDVHALT